MEHNVGTPVLDQNQFKFCKGTLSVCQKKCGKKESNLEQLFNPKAKTFLIANKSMIKAIKRPPVLHTQSWYGPWL